MTQKEALDILKMGHNVFLTGSAGSGKTFLLNKYVDYLKKKSVSIGVTASTGIAATHMNGITIHSWAGIGIKDELTDRDLSLILKKKNLKKRFEKTKVLVIDEVSMLHSFRLDMVDKVCRMFKQNPLPFGGLQVVLCGDFFQLPPISRGGEDARFVNRSQVWNDMKLKVCYLSEQHRQEDDILTSLLNDIRKNNTGEHSLTPLRKCYKKDVSKFSAAIKLHTHNFNVDTVNGRELEKISGKMKEYAMGSKGNRNLVEALKRSCLAPENLVLKKGAVVMFVKNNFEEGYVNGTLGKVVGFGKEGLPVVKTSKGKKITADYVNWKIEEDGKTKAEVWQIPLRLAWAITVHKSQGMTLDAAEIDLSKSFVEGMGYVALSRIKSLNGLRLMGLNEMALKAKEEVIELDKQLIEMSEEARSSLKKINFLRKEKRQKEFLCSVEPTKKEKEAKLSTYEKTKLLVCKKLAVSEMAEMREMTEGTIIGHLEKIFNGGDGMDLCYLKKSFPTSRFKKVEAAFKKTGDTKLSPVKQILGNDFSYDEIRLIRLFL